MKKHILETWDWWAYFYYTEPILILCILFTTIILKKSAKKESGIFLLYAIAGLFLFISDEITKFLIEPNRLRTLLFETSNTFFGLVEIIVFYIFFERLIIQRRTTFIFRIGLFVFTLITIVFLHKMYSSELRTQIVSLSEKLTSIEFIFLLVPFLSYSYLLLQPNTTLKHSLDKSIWIITSLVVYLSLGIPFFLIQSNMFKIEKNLYCIMQSLHHISLAILYLTIASSYMTKVVPVYKLKNTAIRQGTVNEKF